MTALLLAVVAASLAGSLHCVGMCGAFVAFYSGGDAGTGPWRFAIHGVYSLGRLAAYAVLGAAAGTLGATLDLAGRLAGLQRTAALVAGVVMIGWGVAALLQARGVRLVGWHGPKGAAGLLRRGLSRVAGAPPLARAGTVGVLTGLLPCGWLWAFLVTAAGTAGAASGALVMTAFWLGTVPALVALGLGVQLAGLRLRRAVPAIAAVLLIVLGGLAIALRPSPARAAAAATRIASEDPATEAAAVSALDHTESPCCASHDQ